MKSKSRGFTLIELMVVLSIAAAILVVGVPAYNNFRLNGRMTNSANDMLSATVLARTEAIKRQATVALCSSANPLAAQPTCTAGSNVGWIVFVDADGDCKHATDGTETLIDSRPFDNTITTNPLVVKFNGACLSFAPTGFTNTTSNMTQILMCDKRGTAKQAGLNVSAARGLVVSKTGRARITRDVTSGALPDDITQWTGATGTCP